jgi:hypothetical protein
MHYTFNDFKSHYESHCTFRNVSMAAITTMIKEISPCKLRVHNKKNSVS